jgi:hypothetical protein
MHEGVPVLVGKPPASEAGINEGVIFLHPKYTKHTAAHRDGSPYPLRTGHLPDPKEVGRTVSVSRRGKSAFFRVFGVFRG